MSKLKLQCEKCKSDLTPLLDYSNVELGRNNIITLPLCPTCESSYEDKIEEFEKELDTYSTMKDKIRDIINDY